MFTYASTNSFCNEESNPVTLYEWNLPQYQLDYVLMESDRECNCNSLIINNNENICGNNNSNNNSSTFSVGNTANASLNTISYSTVPLFVAEAPLSTNTPYVIVNNSCCHCHNHNIHSLQTQNVNNVYCASNDGGSNNAINNEYQYQPLQLQYEQERCEEVQHNECSQSKESMQKSNYYSHGSVDAVSVVGLTPSLSCLQSNNNTCYSASTIQPHLCSVTREYTSQERESANVCRVCSRQQDSLHTHDNEELPSSRELCCYAEEDNDKNFNSHMQSRQSITTENCDVHNRCAESLITEHMESSNYMIVNVATDGKVYLLPAQETEAFIAQNTLESQVEMNVQYSLEPTMSCAFTPQASPLYTLRNIENVNWLLPCECSSKHLVQSMESYNTCEGECTSTISNIQHNNLPQILAYNVQLPHKEQINNFSCSIASGSKCVHHDHNNNKSIYDTNQINYNNQSTSVANIYVLDNALESVEDANYNDLHVLSDEKWSELLKLKGVRWHYDPYQANLLCDSDHLDDNWEHTDNTESEQNIALNSKSYRSYNDANYSCSLNGSDDACTSGNVREVGTMLWSKSAMLDSYFTPSTKNASVPSKETYNAKEEEALCEEEEEQKKEWENRECCKSMSQNDNINGEEEQWRNSRMPITESRQEKQYGHLHTKEEVQNESDILLQYQTNVKEQVSVERHESHSCNCCHEGNDRTNKEQLLECITHTPHRHDEKSKLSFSLVTSVATECSTPGAIDTLTDTPSSRRFPTSKTRLRYSVLPPSSTPLSEDKHTPSRSKRDRVSCKKLYDTTVASVELFESRWSNFEPHCDEQSNAMRRRSHEHRNLQPEQKLQYEEGVRRSVLEDIPAADSCERVKQNQQEDNIISDAGLVRSPAAKQTLQEDDQNNSKEHITDDVNNTNSNTESQGDNTNKYNWSTSNASAIRSDRHYNGKVNRRYTDVMTNKLRRMWLRDAQLQDLHDLWYAACKLCRFDKLWNRKDHEADENGNDCKTSNCNSNKKSSDQENYLHGCFNGHENLYQSPEISKYDEHNSVREQRHRSQTSFVIRPGLRLEYTIHVQFKYLYILRHHHRRSFAVSNSVFSPNTLVVVDGDRGVEMGVIDAVYSQSVLCTMTRSELKQAGLLEQNINTSIRVYREASESELAFYVNTLTYLEVCTLNFLYQLQHASYFNNCAIDRMEFIACEFQADCQKLYVYYRSPVKVRILELATFLYQIYPCRIWIEDVGKLAT